MNDKKYFFETVLLSDVHLGSNLCQAKELYTFLHNSHFNTLILIGDIFDNINMKRLKKSHFKVLEEIRKLTKTTNVIWVRGNHDEIPSNLMSLILGVEVLNSYSWEHYFNGNKYKLFAIHGDIWDVFIYKYKTVTKVATLLFNGIQALNSDFIFNITKKLKFFSKKFTRNVQSIRNSAFEYAKTKHIKGIFCGHTHYAEILKSNGVVYGNDGTWQTDIPSFIHIHENKVSLCSYINNDVVFIQEELLD